jgi:putative spermidine/putrescine transport system permease protein
VRRRRTPVQDWVRSAGFSTVWLLRVLALLLLFIPIVLVMYVSFGADAYTVIPPSGYSLRWYANIFQQPQFIDGFVTSLRIAAIVTPSSVIIGTLAAYGLWLKPTWLTRLIEPVLLAPIMVPLVVTGLALLAIFNRMEFYNSFWNIVIGHILITFPYAARAVGAVLTRYNRQFDEAAASVGARPWQTLLYVTLPLVRPGIFAGALFTLVMSFDDFAVTIFLIDPNTTTLPITIYQYMEWNLDPTVSAVSTVLVLVAVAGTLLVEKVIGLDRFVGIRT